MWWSSLQSIVFLLSAMATHLGLGRGVRVMKGEISRTTLQGWRKDALVDVVMSLALAAGAIPDVCGHLEAAHVVAVASPSRGGGVEAAVQQLRNVVWQSGPTAPVSLPEDTNPDASVQGSGVAANPDNSCLADDPGSNANTSQQVEDESVPTNPICRSLWKGKTCENPDTCNRAHKRICAKEACKTARDPECLDWHYRPKKQRPGLPSSSRHQGNGNRGWTAPGTKQAKSKSKRHMSQATERMYHKWKMSEVRLEQSKIMASTYRDILMSTPDKGLPSHVQAPTLFPTTVQKLSQKSVGHPAASAHAQQRVALMPAAAESPPPVNGLGAIVEQLNIIVSALTTAGILSNKH